eukprot:455615-Rhodomonas_salina.1
MHLTTTHGPAGCWTAKERGALHAEGRFMNWGLHAEEHSMDWGLQHEAFHELGVSHSRISQPRNPAPCTLLAKFHANTDSHHAVSRRLS